MFEIKPILSALSRHKSSTLLIVLQIAITFAVVVNAISIIKQRITLMERESGIAETQLISLNVNAIGNNYDIEQNVRADIQLLRATPGIIDAVFLNQIPLSGSGNSSRIAVSKENYDNQIYFNAGVFRGDSHTINTLGVKLYSGRTFSEDEIQYSTNYVRPSSIIITKSLADKIYPNENPLGKTPSLEDSNPTIIGVIKQMSGSIVQNPFFDDNIIFPLVHLTKFMRILIRVETDSLEEILGNVEKILLDRNSQRVIVGVRSLKKSKQRSYSHDYAMTKILWAVIVLLTAVTALGIVGIVSFNVNQQIKQIGTRRALGATKSDIQRYFLTENILISLMGLIIGTFLSIWLNLYLIQSFNMNPVNWVYIPVGMLAMLSIGILSVWVPAKKASEVLPVVATQSI